VTFTPFRAPDRLQRQICSLFGGFPSNFRSCQFGAFPHINIGTTDDTIEIIALAPGVESAPLEIFVDKGLLAIAGERTTDQPQKAQHFLYVVGRDCQPRPQPTDCDRVSKPVKDN
jgi:HSP20 family molecular chaperone IbpA